MKRVLAFVASVGLLFAMVFTPAAAHGLASHPHQAAFSIGLVLDVGGVNDKSFNNLAYRGMQRAERVYHVKGTYLASNSEADYVPNLTHYAQLHPNLIIATGVLMSTAIYQVARQYSHQKFAIIDGAPTDAKGNVHNLSNVANLLFHEQESGYLAGVIAGLMEKGHIGKAVHNTIGYMGGIPVPAVIRYEAGYVAGAKKVDPGITVLGGYSQSFTNQGAGNTIGRQQIARHADVLFAVAGGSGLGYLAAAQQAGVYGIGVDADQGYLGRYIITSAIKRVDVAVFQTVSQLRSGHFRPGTHLFTLKNNGTGFGKTSSVVPASIVAEANMYKGLIRSGKIVPPTKIP